MKVIEINLEEVLKCLNFTKCQFVDLCILCGCDYSEGIEGIGSTKAFNLLEEYKDIEGVLKWVDEENSNPKKKKKYEYSDESFNYKECRELFLEPDVGEFCNNEIIFKKVEFVKLKEFLIEKGFDEDRVDRSFNRIQVIIIFNIENR